MILGIAKRIVIFHRSIVIFNWSKELDEFKFENVINPSNLIMIQFVKRKALEKYVLASFIVQYKID